MSRFRTVLLFTLLLAITAVVMVPIIQRMRIHTDMPIGPFFDVVELSQLGRAMENYKQKFGEYPPPPDSDKVIDHVWRVYWKVADPDSILRSAGLDLDCLDDRESLVFWLGGRAAELFLGRPECLYPFDSRRLVDADGDEWLEYIDGDGDHFGIVDGKVAIESRKLGRSMTLDQIEREFTNR